MKQNVMRKRNYLYEFLGILEIAAIYFIWVFILKSWINAVYAACATYYPVAWTLRLTLQRHHRSGMRYVKRENYAEAVKCFEKSELFFERYAWVDKYRFITMFSSSAYSYREMAMQNQVYSLIRLNRIPETVIVLKRLLAAAPDREDVAQMLEKIKAALDSENIQKM